MSPLLLVQIIILILGVVGFATTLKAPQSYLFAGIVLLELIIMF